MKNNNSNFLRSANHKEINTMSNISPEKNLKEVNTSSAKPIFSIADLWNIQKNRRTGFAKRRNSAFAW